jgi:hypothetical protein
MHKATLIYISNYTSNISGPYRGSKKFVRFTVDEAVNLYQRLTASKVLALEGWLCQEMLLAAKILLAVT